MLRGVGVSANRQQVVLYLQETKIPKSKLSFITSANGVDFSAPEPLFGPRPAAGQKIAAGNFFGARSTVKGESYEMTFNIANGQLEPLLYQATSKNLKQWTAARLIKGISQPAVLAPESKTRKHRLLFFGQQNIGLASGGARQPWKILNSEVLSPRGDFFDNEALLAGQARENDEGLMLTYYAQHIDGDYSYLSVGVAMFDSQNPARVIWRTEYPLWQQPESLKELSLFPLGEADFMDKTLFFVQDEEGKIFSVELPLWNAKPGKVLSHHPRLERLAKNPVLGPKPEHAWESKAAFNPAAFAAEGRVHLIYRAIGDEDISSFGYASSQDGAHFDQRLNYPVYYPREEFEGSKIKRPPTVSSFASGGTGIGGCEDPRATLIDDTLYLTYVAFDGWRPPRVALTSIALKDFLAHRFNWKNPALISPYVEGEGNKNGCILPEKVNGKYAIFHRIYPDILIDYVDNLEFDNKSKWLSKKGHAKISPRKTHWDSRKVGAGATPVKTPLGWLLVYQAVGFQDQARYKMGAMLLDLQDPSKVLARGSAPILEPETWYENEGWKYGVVYPCGASIVGDELFVYYGGADTYTCAAKANLEEFLGHLLKHQPAALSPLAMA